MRFEVSAVEKAAFRLVNTGTAKPLFCKTCGIKSFYVPRSHPDGISVNARCLDEGTVTAIKTRAFDGANWEASAKGRDR